MDLLAGYFCWMNFQLLRRRLLLSYCSAYLESKIFNMYYILYIHIRKSVQMMESKESMSDSQSVRNK